MAKNTAVPADGSIPLSKLVGKPKSTRTKLGTLAARAEKAEGHRTRWAVKQNEANAAIWLILDRMFRIGGEYQFTTGPHAGRWFKMMTSLQPGSCGRERGHAPACLLNSRTRQFTGKSVRMVLWVAGRPDADVRVGSD